MKIYNCAQGSDEWLALRLGVPTASEMDRLVSPTGKVRTGDGPQTFLYEKLAEKWTGLVLPSAGSSFDMEQGTILEDKAKPAYTVLYGEQIESVGFVTTDDGKVGCSPDGVFYGKDSGIEIKCPKIQTHIGYLLQGVLPSDYALQVQTCIYVCGCDSWKFMSFHRKAPPFVLTVPRDEKIQKSIAEAVAWFWERFNDAYAQLVKANDGEEPERPVRKPVENLDMWPKAKAS